jgi:hypothetical protein
MPQTQVIFYREDDGSVPVLDWFDGLGDKARAKFLVRIERLKLGTSFAALKPIICVTSFTNYESVSKGCTTAFSISFMGTRSPCCHTDW